MTVKYTARAISAALLVSLCAALQPVKATASPAEVLAGVAIGTAFGLGSAKAEEFFEEEDGSVPFKHLAWLWPASFLARTVVVQEVVASAAGYNTYVVKKPDGSLQTLASRALARPSWLATWVSYIIARRLHGQQLAREKAEATPEKTS